MLESGTLTPVIDRQYGLAEAADALRYVAEGHAAGKVVVNVADPS
jgi:NADPH:quinone reductase-like Zn-dependent oxidoreductase